MSLSQLLEQADAGPWWYDGRDIFHKKPGTNLDQIIIPIPDKHETFHPSQAVTPATAQLAALAPDAIQLLTEMADALDYGYFDRTTDTWRCAMCDAPEGHNEGCSHGELAARYAALDAKTVQ